MKTSTLKILDRIIDILVKILHLILNFRYSAIKVSVFCCAEVSLVSEMFSCMNETLKMKSLEM
jgi:hypothetical protein